MKYAAAALLVLAIGAVPAMAQRKVTTSPKSPATGIASYYAQKFHGRKTASGEIFDNTAMTAAHNTLPLGTMIKVTNIRNNRWVIVKVTDRLHAANRRIVDLTQAAAKQLGFIHWGITKVRVEVVSKEFVNSLPFWEMALN
ncbi:septal ring lytic transglycosylase RlpA family protein [Chitinophaga sp. GCM10012297]|uniref:Probable endolytic peptidoglycan transglycosylase RlpA n=1 Tax=Chitinophaga chungangae TaxID=2821488 RepID=A0ABS3YMA1_9BACT|nr:septal ring lytic transglycosylase RlpA family protein [Chitinophaga chungangae]MBO9155378.1 septal ring lytic transglycosylase RlpA family protein [Chitinophaga chungangae]